MPLSSLLRRQGFCLFRPSVTVCRIPRIGVTLSEKLSYDEAKGWFWFRTWLWSAAAAVASVVACFMTAARLIEPFGIRFWVSVAVGVGVVLAGLISARVSIRRPWMRTGWRSAFLLNGAFCIFVALVFVLLICAWARTILLGDPAFPRPEETMDAGYALMQFAIAGSAVWAFVFGSWFALRMDRYFVESI